MTSSTSIVSWAPPLSDMSPSRRRCRGRPADSGDQLFLWLASSGIDRIADPTRLTKDFYSKSNFPVLVRELFIREPFVQHSQALRVSPSLVLRRGQLTRQGGNSCARRTQCRERTVWSRATSRSEE